MLYERILANNDTSIISKFIRIRNLLPDPSTWTLYPRSGVVDNFVLLTEDALIQIIGAKNLGAKRAQDLKDLHTGRFLCNLFGPNLGKSFQFIQDVDQLKDAKRFILTSYIRTNGLELQVLFLDASRHPLRAQTTKLDGKLVETTRLALSSPEKCDIQQDLSLCSEDGCDCSSPHIDINNMWILGVDAGGFCARKPGQEDSVRNMTISSAVLSQPIKSYQYWLKAFKAKWQSTRNDLNLNALEQDLTRRAGESLPDYILRYNMLYSSLSDFYNSRVVKKQIGRAHV